MFNHKNKRIAYTTRFELVGDTLLTYPDIESNEPTESILEWIINWFSFDPWTTLGHPWDGFSAILPTGVIWYPPLADALGEEVTGIYYWWSELICHLLAQYSDKIDVEIKHDVRGFSLAILQKID